MALSLSQANIRDTIIINPVTDETQGDPKITRHTTNEVPFYYIHHINYIGHTIKKIPSLIESDVFFLFSAMNFIACKSNLGILFYS